MAEQLWRKNFSSDEAFQIAKLKLMIKLTERARGKSESDKYLDRQIVRLNAEIDELSPKRKKRLTKKKTKGKLGRRKGK